MGHFDHLISISSFVLSGAELSQWANQLDLQKASLPPENSSKSKNDLDIDV